MVKVTVLNNVLVLVETLRYPTIGVSTGNEKGKSRGERGTGRAGFATRRGDQNYQVGVDMGVWAVPPWKWCVS
jgi:hypothetical protein